MPTPESSTPVAVKIRKINELREALGRLERGGSAPRPALALGIPAVDTALGGGLATGCLHEVLAGPDGGSGDAAATGFGLALLARLLGGDTRPALWCARRIDLYGPGLAAFGLDPGRLILLEAAKPAELLWAMEEGLRCPGLAAVVAELDGLDLTAGRRLQLAAEAGGATGLVLGRRAGGASAATRRWRVTPRPAAGMAAGGSARWHVELLRCRGGRPRDWEMEWHDGTGDLALAAALRDRPAAAPAAG